MNPAAALPEHMRQIEISGPGGPDVLRLAEGPVPTPGYGQVLIRVAAAGVNRPDVLQRQGLYPPPPGASLVPGLEVAGTIAATGRGVSEWSAGAAVCALLPGGGYADYAVVEAALVLPVPDGLPAEEAAGLPEAVFTVWGNVFERGRLRPGETFLVHGGASGIGTIAIQLAHAMGARTFATAGSDKKCAICLQLGAARAINYRTEDFVAVMHTLTAGRGVDVILDMVGGGYVARNLQALAEDGRLVQIAFLEGAKVTLDLLPLMLRRQTITGSTLRARPLEIKAALAEAVRNHVWPLVAEGRVRPVIDSRFPLSQAAEAHRRLEKGGHIGKILLIP